MKKLGLALLMMVMVVSLSFNAFAADIVLKLGHGAPQDNPRHIVAKRFAKYVKEQTNGKVKINIFPSESLGSDREMAEMVAMGALDMSINSQGPVASYAEKLNVVGLPFLFSKPEQAYAVLDSDYFMNTINDELKDDGMKVLAFWENGFRHITNNVRPIYKPEDLKGLKIRTPKDDMTLAIFKTLGANPAPLAFGELYMALSQGAFDGQENPITNIYYANLHEVQKYLSLTNHKYETCPLIISTKTWNKLPDDVKEVLKKGAMKFAKVHREMNRMTNEKLLTKVKEAGMKVNKADVEALKEATKPVYDQFRPKFGADLMNKVQEIIDNN